MARRALRVVRDPIYGYVEIPPRLAPLVDNPLTQRLRRVGQTSMTHSVYPAATGTRFEHALGAMHLARRAWRASWANAYGGEAVQQRFEAAVHGDVRVTARDFPALIEDAVGAVGLLHDLGHPPFSHVLEGEFLRLADEDRWITRERPAWIRKGDFHEFAGVVLLEQLCQDLARSGPADEDDFLGLVRTIYEADPARRTWAGALHSLVAGEIDVDRLDYLMRDAQKAGTEFGAIDFERLVDALELHPLPADQWRIAPGVRARSAVETLLVQRTQSYRWITFHSRVVGTNLALSEAVALLLRLAGDKRLVTVAGEGEVTLGELFVRLVPRLNYLTPRRGDLRAVAAALPAWTPREHDVDRVFAEMKREAQASFDDASSRNALAGALELAVVILDEVGLEHEVSADLVRLRTYARTVLHRQRNFVSAWKTVDEFSRAVERSRQAIEVRPGLASQSVEEVLTSVYTDVIADLREQGRNAAARTHQEDLAHRLEHLQRDAAAEVNDLFRTLIAGSKKRQARLCELLAEAETQFDAGEGFWQAAYASFTPVEEDEKAAVLYDGDTERSMRETSALARALEDAEEHRVRLFIYFFVTAPDLERWRTENVESARASLIGAFLQTFPVFLQDVMREFLLAAVPDPQDPPREG